MLLWQIKWQYILYISPLTALYRQEWCDKLASWLDLKVHQELTDRCQELEWKQILVLVRCYHEVNIWPFVELAGLFSNYLVKICVLILESSNVGILNQPLKKKGPGLCFGFCYLKNQTYLLFFKDTDTSHTFLKGVLKKTQKKPKQKKPAFLCLLPVTKLWKLRLISSVCQSRLPLSSEWFSVFCHTSSATAIHRAIIDCTGLCACTFVFYLHVYLRCLTCYVSTISPCDTSISQRWNSCLPLSLHLWCFASQGETLDNILIIAIFSLIIPSINHHMAKSTCRGLYAKIMMKLK